MANPINLTEYTTSAVTTSSVFYQGSQDSASMYAYVQVTGASYNPTTEQITFSYAGYIQMDPSNTWLPVDAVGFGIDSYDNVDFENNGEGTIWHTGYFSSMPFPFATGTHTFSANQSVNKHFYVKLMSLSAGYYADRWKNGSYCYPGDGWINFTIPSYTLTVKYGDGGSSTSGGGKYTYGKSVTISATPADGYSFSRWSDGDTNQTRTVEVTADATYTAQFTSNGYTVSYNVNAPSGASGTIPSAPASQTKQYGVNLTLRGALDGSTMIPPYRFTEWKADNSWATFPAGGTYDANVATVMYAQWEIDYDKPTITTNPIPVVYRSTSSGTSSDTGEYAHIEVSGTYDSTFVTSAGSVTVTLKYRESGQANYSTATISPSTATLSSGNYTISTTTTSNLFDANKAYDIEISVSDSSGQTYTPNTFTTFLSTTHYTMDINESGTSVSLGMSAPSVPSGSEGLFQVNPEWKVNLPQKTCIWSPSDSAFIQIADFVVETGTSGIWKYTKWNSGKAECKCITTMTWDYWDDVGNIFYSYANNGEALRRPYPSGFFTSIDSFDAHFLPNSYLIWESLESVPPDLAHTPRVRALSPVRYTASDSLTCDVSIVTTGTWK